MQHISVYFKYYINVAQSETSEFVKLSCQKINDTAH